MSCFCDGDPNAPIMLVGMAPGREELAKDTPFIGGSGKLLWSRFKSAGIDRADCYIVNTIGEWPEGRDGNPTPEQYNKWWDEFDAAAGNFRGRIVVPLGGAALWRYTGIDGGIEKWAGYVERPNRAACLERTTIVYGVYKTNTKNHKKGDPKPTKQRVATRVPISDSVEIIIPALHPAGVLRSGNTTLPSFNGTCKRVGRALRGALLPFRDHYVEYPIIRANEAAVAFDIETESIYSDAISRIAIADSLDTWTVLWNSGNRDAVRSMLSNGSGIKIAHNIGFDLPRLESAGVAVVGPLYDTMLACAMLQPDLPKGLNAAAALYLDRPRWKHEADSRPAYYNATDASATRELWSQTSALLDETQQRGLFDTRIMGAIRDIIRMSVVGVRVDRSRKDAWIASLEGEGTALLKEWEARTGGVNYKSTYKLREYFYSIGMSPKINKYGAESTDQQTIQMLKAEYPAHSDMLNCLLKLRHTFKELSTYANTAVGPDGRVHASFVPAFKDEDSIGKGLSGTWRITAKSPNLQNQPTEARKQYVPDDGMVFIGADYSQLEARILAAVSGDEHLMDACNAGIHTVNATKLGVDKTRAKNGFYGWGYLAGARTLHNTFKGRGYNVPIAECQALLDSFDREYAVAAAHRRQIIAAADAKKYTQNPFGLRRYFPHFDLPAPAVVSSYIQSTAAIMMWTCIPAIAAGARALGGELLITVHDDVLCQVPVAQRDAGLKMLREVMEQEFPEIAPGFRAPVGLKWSDKSWGEMEEVNEAL